MGALLLLGLLFFADATADPCGGQAGPSILTRCGGVSAPVAAPVAGLDAYMRYEYGILQWHRRHDQRAYYLKPRESGELLPRWGDQ